MAERREPGIPQHGSLDREHPTGAGPTEPDGATVPGTGVFGDETLVRPAEGVVRPGIVAPAEPDPPAPGES